MAKLPERDLKAFWNRLKDVYEYFRSRGISDEVAAGILGNAAREGSGFWDDVVNSVVDKHGVTHYYYGGILNEQETYDWVKEKYGGYKKEHQIKYIADGLLGLLPDIQSERGSLLNTRFINFVNKAKSSKSPSDIAYFWEDLYEISGKSRLDERLQCAEYFYKLMQKMKPKSSTKLNKSKPKSLPKWANPDFSKPVKPIKKPFFDLTLNDANLEYPRYNLTNVKTEFDLPLYASNYKNGGKLIKRGQLGMLVTYTSPYSTEIQLERNPISHPELQNFIPGLDPEERMDAAVLQLVPLYNPITRTVSLDNTYIPTSEQLNLKMVPLSDIDKAYYGAVTSLITLPIGGITLKYTPKLGLVIWGAIKLTMKNPKPFLKNLFYDTGAWVGLNEGTRLVTGESADEKLNWRMGFPKKEGPAFLLTGTAAGIGRRLTTKGINLASQILSPKYDLKVNLQNSIKSSPLITHTPEGVFIQNLAKETIRPLTLESMLERAILLTQQLKDLLKDLGEETVQLYSDKEAEEIKRLAVVLGLKPKNGVDGDVTFIGQINRDTPLDKALVNLYNYRIKNNFTLTQDNISLPNYIINTPEGLNFVNASNNPEKYTTSLTKQPIIASILKNYDSGSSGFRMTTDVGRAHSQIHTAKTPLEAKIITIHENIGHGMNPLAKYYQSNTFGGKTMQLAYEDLANNIWNPIVAQTLYREYTLPWAEIQAEVSNINSFILKRLKKVYNMSSEQLLELSEKLPEKLDLMFKTTVDNLSAEELQSMLSTIGSRYARQMIRFMPGSNGLAAQDLVFNFMVRPLTPSNELFLYDTLKLLRDKNSQYTQEQANAYLNAFKNVLKYGFSILGLGTNIKNQN